MFACYPHTTCNYHYWPVPIHTGSTVFQLAVTVRSSMMKTRTSLFIVPVPGQPVLRQQTGIAAGSRSLLVSLCWRLFNTPFDQSEPEKVESGHTNNINTRGERHCLLSLPGKPRCPNVGTNPGQLTHLFPGGSVSSGAWRQLRPRVRQAAPGAPPCPAARR